MLNRTRFAIPAERFQGFVGAEQIAAGHEHTFMPQVSTNLLPAFALFRITLSSFTSVR